MLGYAAATLATTGYVATLATLPQHTCWKEEEKELVAAAQNHY